MNEIQIFSKEEFGEIRSVLHNEQPYFVGNDVAKALEGARIINEGDKNSKHD